MTKAISVSVNGVSHQHEVEPRLLLVHYLRDVLSLTGTHIGCETSLCGACTILIDGQAVKSCTMLSVQADGAKITTIEGLSPNGSHPVQKAWAALDVPQCGYCQSGQIMAAAALLKKNPNPTDKDIDDAMTNICRCGTYQRIRAAVHLAAGTRTADVGHSASNA